MSWVIRKIDPRGGYVAPVAAAKPFTPHLSQARRFVTRDAAEHVRCPIDEVLMQI